MRPLFLLCICLVFQSSFAFAHSGGTDASGGHNDRRNGGYHYHGSSGRSSSASQRISSLQNAYGSTFSRVPTATSHSTTPNPRTSSRTQPRTAARTTWRSLTGSTATDSRRKVARKSYASRHPPVERFFDFVEPNLPSHRIVEEAEEDGLRKLLVEVDYETGMPRPTFESLVRLIRKLAGNVGVKCQFQLPRGESIGRSWAMGFQVGNQDPSLTMIFNETDFEVFGVGRVTSKAVIRIIVYPPRGQLPTERELRKIADSLDLADRILIAFYLPRMNPEAPPWALYTTGKPASLRVFSERGPK